MIILVEFKGQCSKYFAAPKPPSKDGGGKRIFNTRTLIDAAKAQRIK